MIPAKIIFKVLHEKANGEIKVTLDWGVDTFSLIDLIQDSIKIIQEQCEVLEIDNETYEIVIDDEHCDGSVTIRSNTFENAINIFLNNYKIVGGNLKECFKTCLERYRS